MWPGFDDGSDRWFTRAWFERNLTAVDIVDAGDQPEVIVFSVFGREHQEYIRRGTSAKMVFFTGENVRPPIGRVPLCLSFDPVSAATAGKHERLPLWIFDKELRAVLDLHGARLRGETRAASAQQRAGFCAWVASNAAMHNAKVRLHFVQALSSKYKQVACGGECLNNVNGPVKDKLAFLKGHRFNICFENASTPGYCTEKLLHAFAAGCVPIYWGDPRVSRQARGKEECLGPPDFNPEALISAHDFESPDLLIQHIARVDGDPELFQKYLCQPILSEAWYERLRDWPRFCEGFKHLLFDGADRGTPPLGSARP